MDTQNLKEKLIEYGLELGFSEIKITTAQPFPEWEDAVEKRLKIEEEDRKKWEHRKSRMTGEPRDVMRNAQSLITAVLSYKPFKDKDSKEYGVYSSYYLASNRGYRLIQELAAQLIKWGYQAIANPPLPTKPIARRAGIGYFGKNGILHHPGYGTFMSMHVIVTDAPIPPDPPMEFFTDCGKCTRCIDACPTGAIVEDGTVLLSRCLRSYMESSDTIPVNIREKMGSRLLGCDICQISCPHNRRKIAAPEEAEEQELLSIQAVLTETGPNLKKRMQKIGEKIGKNYARPQRFISLAAIAAGNTEDPRYIPALRKTITHPHLPIRIHSAWALGEIGGEESKRALEEALEHERQEEVQEEIQKALQRIRSSDI